MSDGHTDGFSRRTAQAAFSIPPALTLLRASFLNASRQSAWR